MTLDDFNLQIQTFSSPEDYALNSEVLSNIIIQNNQLLFIKIISKGYTIPKSLEIMQNLLYVSNRYNVDAFEILRLTRIFRKILKKYPSL